MLVGEDYRRILEELLEEHGLVCGLLASSAGAEYARAGDFDSLENRGIVNALVYDGETISRLDASLDTRILPQMVSQGRVHAYVTKPDKETLVVLFSQDEWDIYTRYDFAQSVHASVVSKLAKRAEE